METRLPHMRTGDISAFSQSNSICPLPSAVQHDDSNSFSSKNSNSGDQAFPVSASRAYNKLPPSLLMSDMVANISPIPTSPPQNESIKWTLSPLLVVYFTWFHKFWNMLTCKNNPCIETAKTKQKMLVIVRMYTFTYHIHWKNEYFDIIKRIPLFTTH